MAYEHPRGAGPFVGPQLRYLVDSVHGWLGGVGFAASARRLRARDAWVGWDDTGRRAHLHRVLGLCRLLVRPGVACRNLASHGWAGSSGRSATTASVGMVIAPGCWRRSSTRPNRRGRACARRTGFGWVRRAGAGAGTAGTRRWKRARRCICTPWSRRGAPASRPAVAPLAVGDGLDAEVWAGHEFGGARLGDARLNARLVQSAQHMAESPMRAITGAAHGARALVKGHYRLIDQPADSAVTVDNILAPHRRTLRRMQAHDTVLCIQDGTRLNFTRRGQTQGLGAIGSNQTGAVARGLELHTTLAVNPDGVALGVLRAAFDAPAPPNPAAEGEPTPAARGAEVVPLDRGAARLRAGGRATARNPRGGAMDREADFLDLFIARRAHAPQVDLLVRAKVDRVLGKEKTPDGQTVSRHLFDQVRNAPARGDARVEVQRLSARAKASKQARKDRRAARVAEVTLRYQQVALAPAPRRSSCGSSMCARNSRRPRPSAGVVPADHAAVTSAVDATRILQWYALRWRIEEYFRVLKSGCKVEELQHHTAERLERAMAIKMVIGWRIQLMVQLGREVPDLPGDLLFSDGELRVLATFARSRKLPPPARLGDAVGLVARLGGWLGRTRDPPGAQLMWHGYTQLVAMAFAFQLRDGIRMTSHALRVQPGDMGHGQR